MLKKPPLVLDNTVITRFGLTGRFDILKTLYSGELIIPTEVIVEAVRHKVLEKIVSDALSKGWIKEHTINFKDYPQQCKIYAQLSKRFDPGESAVIAIAQDQGCTVGSDDLRAIVKYCRKNDIEFIGSLGILYHAYSKEIIDEDEGTSIIKDLVRRNDKIPVDNFRDVIEWFKFKRGKRELF